MKKIIFGALLIASFGLIGCSAQDKPNTKAYRDFTSSTADHRPACKKGHKCYGKFGVERTEKDTVK